MLLVEVKMCLKEVAQGVVRGEMIAEGDAPVGASLSVSLPRILRVWRWRLRVRAV